MYIWNQLAFLYGFVGKSKSEIHNAREDLWHLRGTQPVGVALAE
jgi:hypothetical protein